MPPRFQIPFGFVVYLCPEEYLLFMKILIVEDEPSLREIMVQTLRREQYVVEQASDYASALEKIAGYDYDCILLDIMLPDGSGLLWNLSKPPATCTPPFQEKSWK